MPKYTLSHVIRERYPSFVDALRDLDDALCLVSLFANFPQHQTLELSAKDIQMCQRLYKEWMTYCSISQCIKKVFFSIKGIYYQVELMGQSVTWVSPYTFNQRLPFDIDYRVISTFREFYTALLRFINYKLYAELGMSYPPKDLQGCSNDITEGTDAAEGGIYIDSSQIRECQTVAQKKFQEQFEASVGAIGVSDEFKDTPEIRELTKKHEHMKR